MFFSEDRDVVTYTELMEEIKKINTDWLDLRQSREYRIGLVINKLFLDMKTLNFSSISSSIKRWKKGINSKRIISNKGNKIVSLDNNSNYFSEDKIAIYTGVFGGYDSVPEPYSIPDNCDFYIFTDQLLDNPKSVWKKKDEPTYLSNLSNIEKNRYLKMHPHDIFPDYKYSIYIDGNVQIITDLTEYINILNHVGIAIHMHDTRNCVFDELKAIEKTKRETIKNITAHREYLISTGMPRNYGLLQCNIIVREHNNSLCQQIMEAWWEEFQSYTKRDQISLPHVLFRQNISISEIGILGSSAYKNPSFRIYNHN